MKLRDQGSAHVRKKQNVTGKDTGVFMIEAFAKSVVFEVFKFGPDVPREQRMKFFATEYTRKDNGDFDFANTTEVSRITRFEPKSKLVTKAKKAEEAKVCAGGQSVTQCACKTKSSDATPTKCTQKRFGDKGEWMETSKSFWHGAL